jgi:hypothetical protein
MQLTNPTAFLPFLAFAGLVPALFIRYRTGVSAPVEAGEQGDYLPQFATSPVALEMYPEPEVEEETEIEPAEETSPEEEPTGSR